MNPTNPISLLIADDHEIFRKGLRLIIQQMTGMEVMGEAANGKELLEKIEHGIRPDIILTDVRMPVMDGIEATQRILDLVPNQCILALSMFGEEEYLEQMIQAGARGFLLKNIDKSELEKAIRQVVMGQHYFSGELLPYFTRKFIAQKPFSPQESTFSQREMEVLNWIAKGLTSKEIADKLFISPRTVEGHKANMIEKTGSKNIVELIIYAIKNELVRI